jgi:hypothetical protein
MYISGMCELGETDAGKRKGKEVLPSPLSTIKTITSDQNVRNYIFDVTKHLERPTFMPVTNKTIYKVGNKANDHIHIPALLLVAAVQILLFAPEKYERNMKLSR